MILQESVKLLLKHFVKNIDLWILFSHRILFQFQLKKENFQKIFTNHCLLYHTFLIIITQWFPKHINFKRL